MPRYQEVTHGPVLRPRVTFFMLVFATSREDRRTVPLVPPPLEAPAAEGADTGQRGRHDSVAGRRQLRTDGGWA
jgi:hypothetical protein